MLNAFGEKIAKFFGEGSHGLNTGYVPLSEAPDMCDHFFKYLPYDSFDPESQLFFNKGSTGFCLMGTPIAGASLNDQEKIDKFFTQEGNLPEGCSMQFLLVGSPRISDKLAYWQSYRTAARYEGLTQKRYDFLKEQAFDKSYPVRDFKVIVSYSVPGLKSNPIEKESLRGIRTLLQGTLSKVGLHTVVMQDKELIREVGNILNHEKTTQQDEGWYSEYEEIAKLIPDADVDSTLTKEGLLLRGGEFVAHSFVPKTSPKYWALGHMDKLFGDILRGHETIPCPFLMHYGFTICEGQTRQKKRAELKREMAQKACESGLTKWQSGVEEEYLESCEIVKELQQGERVIDACFSMTTFCPPQELPGVKNTLESIWNENGWSTKSATYNHLNVLLGSLPMMWTTGLATAKRSFGLNKTAVGAGSSFSALGLTRKTITKEPQNLLPIVAEWTGQRAPGLPLMGRRGQLAFWSPFDGSFIPGSEMYRTSGNYNFCVTGASGSGKSFLCCELITNTLAVGGKAFVMDKGGSFANLCHSLGGHHINFDFSKPFSVNPFSHIPEGDAAEAQKARVSLFRGLQSIVRQMAFPSGQQNDAEIGLLNEAITEVWHAEGSRGSIDSISDFLMKSGESRSQDMARCLLDFTSKGLYGAYFNPPANIDINHDFIVVETDNLEEPLKGVMVMMMMVQVWQRMIVSDRKTPFLLLIDEAWDLLQGQASSAFISAMARTSRKYRFSLGIATQALTDFFDEKSSGPRAAWENSAWKIVFSQNADTLSGLKDHPQLKELVKEGYRETMLRSLAPARGFSEMVLFHELVPCVPVRLFCDPYSTVLYSTNASEVSMIKDFQASGKTLDESIEAVLVQRQRDTR
jgi:conjugal transfer ATP-binding protein TraC